MEKYTIKILPSLKSKCYIFLFLFIFFIIFIYWVFFIAILRIWRPPINVIIACSGLWIPSRCCSSLGFEGTNARRRCTKTGSQLDIMVKESLKVLKKLHLFVYMCYGIILCEFTKSKIADICGVFHFVSFADKCRCKSKCIWQPRLGYPVTNWFASLECHPRGWIKKSITPRRKAEITFDRLDIKQCKRGLFLWQRIFNRVTKHIVPLSRGGDSPPRLCFCVLPFQPRNWIGQSAKIVPLILLYRGCIRSRGARHSRSTSFATAFNINKTMII